MCLAGLWWEMGRGRGRAGAVNSAAAAPVIFNTASAGSGSQTLRM